MKKGSRHWIFVKITSLVLIPFSLWLLYSLFNIGNDLNNAVSFLRHPINAGGIILFIYFALYHAILGLEAILFDYIDEKKVGLIIKFSYILMYVLVTLVAYSVYSIF